LEFRLGVLNVGVTIVDHADTAPEMAEVEALATQLQANLEQALAGTGAMGPGLSEQVVRVSGIDWGGFYPYAAYQRLAGSTIPLAWLSTSDLSILERYYGAATDVYASKAADLNPPGLDFNV
jgi:hypothetical protein